MKKILVVGGNGFARECFVLLKEIQNIDKDIIFTGFLGHGGYGHTVDYMNLQYYYKGEVSSYNFSEDEYVVIDAGYPPLRKKIYNDLKQQGVKFYTLCYNSRICDNIEVGDANIFISTNICSHNIKIGNCNLFNGQILVGHDVSIGDFNFFGPRVSILGEVKIGNHNQVGTNSVLLPHAKIGNNNKIAPLSAVYKGCRNNCYLHGNPALKVGEIEENKD